MTARLWPVAARYRWRLVVAFLVAGVLGGQAASAVQGFAPSTPAETILIVGLSLAVDVGALGVLWWLATRDTAAQAQDEDVCGEAYEHQWQPGDVECRRCHADLSHWNDDEDED